MTFVVIPCVVLILYPTRLFHKCLNRCRIRWHALHVFADAFNGCYKDGTNDTRDYRSFAGFYLLFRICFLVQLTPYTEYETARSFLTVTTLVTFALASPYKVRFFNLLDSLWIALTTYIFISGPETYTRVMYALGTLALYAYLIAYIFCRIVFRLRFRYCQTFKKFAEKIAGVQHRNIKHSTSQSSLEENFPHRMLNPEHYALLDDDDEQTQLITESVVPTYGM